MRLLIAFFLPWLTFFTIGRPVAGLICLLLQITLIGWIPATIWAVYALSQFKTDRKIARAMGQRACHHVALEYFGPVARCRPMVGTTPAAFNEATTILFCL